MSSFLPSIVTPSLSSSNNHDGIITGTLGMIAPTYCIKCNGQDYYSTTKQNRGKFCEQCHAEADNLIDTETTPPTPASIATWVHPMSLQKYSAVRSYLTSIMNGSAFVGGRKLPQSMAKRLLKGHRPHCDKKFRPEFFVQLITKLRCHFEISFA